MGTVINSAKEGAVKEVVRMMCRLVEGRVWLVESQDGQGTHHLLVSEDVVNDGNDVLAHQHIPKPTYPTYPTYPDQRISKPAQQDYSDSTLDDYEETYDTNSSGNENNDYTNNEKDLIK